MPYLRAKPASPPARQPREAMNAYPAFRAPRRFVRLAALLLAPALAAPATRAQVALAAEIRPGSEASAPQFPAALGGLLYFGATDGVRGQELWAYDPAANGGEGAAALIADIVPGPSGSAPFYLEPLDGKLYFSASGTASYQPEVWMYDPATGEAALTDDIGGPAGSFPAELTALDGRLYFNAYTAGQGRELWVYDPATGDATRVTDISADPNDLGPQELTALAGKLYFRARTESAGSELWVYDPATGEAQIAADINPGPGSSSPSSLAVFNGTLYFAAYSPAYGGELWVYDPATGEATLAADVISGAEGSGPQGTTPLGGRLYFGAADGSDFDDGLGRELWVYDPTTGDAELAADINPADPPPGFPNGSYPIYLTAFNGKLYFSATDRGLGLTFEGNRELWAFDPAADGGAGAASLVAEIQPGTGRRDGSNPSDFIVFDGALYFQADDGARGAELWRLTPPVLLTAFALNSPVVKPGSLEFSAIVRNTTDAPVTGDLRFEARAEGGLTYSRTLVAGATLDAGETAAPVFRLPVGMGVPVGPYTATVSAVGPGASVAAADSFPFEVVVEEQAASGGEGEALGEAAMVSAGGLRLDTPAGRAPAGGVVASPNPASGRVVVALTLTAPSEVRLVLHDALGREVAALDAGALDAGAHRLALDVSALPAGVYVWRLAAGDRVETGRLTVAR